MLPYESTTRGHERGHATKCLPESTPSDYASSCSIRFLPFVKTLWVNGAYDIDVVLIRVILSCVLVNRKKMVV